MFYGANEIVSFWRKWNITFFLNFIKIGANSMHQGKLNFLNELQGELSIVY